MTPNKKEVDRIHKTLLWSWMTGTAVILIMMYPLMISSFFKSAHDFQEKWRLGVNTYGPWCLLPIATVILISGILWIRGRATRGYPEFWEHLRTLEKKPRQSKQ